MIITDAPQHHRFTWPIAAGLKVAIGLQHAIGFAEAGLQLVLRDDSWLSPKQAVLRLSDIRTLAPLVANLTQPWLSDCFFSPSTHTHFSRAFPAGVVLLAIAEIKRNAPAHRYWRRAHTCDLFASAASLPIPTHEPNRSAALRNRPPSIRLSKVENVRSFVCSAEAGKLPSLSEAPSRSFTRFTFCDSIQLVCLLCDAALTTHLYPSPLSSGTQRLSREPASNPAAASGASRSRNAL
jgi:hypothetical protein